MHNILNKKNWPGKYLLKDHPQDWCRTKKMYIFCNQLMAKHSCIVKRLLYGRISQPTRMLHGRTWKILSLKKSWNKRIMLKYSVSNGNRVGVEHIVLVLLRLPLLFHCCCLLRCWCLYVVPNGHGGSFIVLTCRSLSLFFVRSFFSFSRSFVIGYLWFVRSRFMHCYAYYFWFLPRGKTRLHGWIIFLVPLNRIAQAESIISKWFSFLFHSSYISPSFGISLSSHHILSNSPCSSLFFFLLRISLICTLRTL